MEIYYFVGMERMFGESTFTVEDVFNDSSPIFVLNQEEKDYWSGLQLMYGKTLLITTAQEFLHRQRMEWLKGHYTFNGVPELSLPYIFYATYDVALTKTF